MPSAVSDSKDDIPESNGTGGGSFKYWRAVPVVCQRGRKEQANQFIQEKVSGFYSNNSVSRYLLSSYITLRNKI